MMGKEDMHTKLWSRNLNGRDHIRDKGIYGSMLNWILGKQDMK